MSNPVNSKGTVRIALSGVKSNPFYQINFEIIDDRSHSKTIEGAPCPSTRVFQDFNGRDKTIHVGYEGYAQPEDIEKMTQWNTLNDKHSTSDIASFGVGLKYYEYFLTGENTHISRGKNREGVDVFFESGANSTSIFAAASDQKVTDDLFRDIIGKATRPMHETDEIVGSLLKLFENSESEYPFNPATLISTKKINNVEFLGELSDESYIEELVSHTLVKYYHLLKTGRLDLFLRFPVIPSSLNCYKIDGSTFIKLNADEPKNDRIGFTVQKDAHVTKIYKVVDAKKIEIKDSTTAVANGEYLLHVGGVFFRIRKNGNSTLREVVYVSDESKSVEHYYTFTQYQIPEENARGEKYAGIYLKLGDDFTNSSPVGCVFEARHHYEGGAKYRGVIEIPTLNAYKVKQDLQLHGLKATFTLTAMPKLQNLLGECLKIYKAFIKIDKDDRLSIHPSAYITIKSSNVKTKRGRGNPGANYIVQVGHNFYKFGDVTSKQKFKRMGSYNDAHQDLIRDDFPQEILYPEREINIVYLPTVDYKNHESIEKILKEYIQTIFDEDEDSGLLLYNSKNGGGIREYFHCENQDTLKKLIQCIKDNNET